MRYLIVPSAKIAQNNIKTFGELPPVLIPVNEQGTILDSLMKKYYNKIDSIIIIVSEGKEKVKIQVNNYHESKLKIVDIKNLKDLGYTIFKGLQGIKHLSDEDEIIINFADTIISDDIDIIEKDGYFYSEDYHSSIWTFFSERNGIINEIFDKKTNKKEIGVSSKLFVGVFKFTKGLQLYELLEKEIKKKSEIDSFYRAIMEYSNSTKLKAVKSDEWLDIGHTDKYYASKLAIKAREFNHITIDKQRGILSKRSDDIEKFKGEILWYLKLPTNIEYARPRIFSYSLDYNDMYIKMEYYSYYTLHELFLYGELDYNQWKQIFSRIKFVLDDFSKYTVKDQGINISLNDIYLNKTFERLEKIRNDDKFSKLFTNPFLINKHKYMSLNNIMKILKDLIPKMLYNIDTFSIIHGDLCFSNVMIDRDYSFIKLIDPRGNFGKFDIYGDPRYELAKILHSVEGKYDYIIKDKFSLSYNENKFDFEINEKVRTYDITKCFIESFMLKNKISEIRLIEALLFLSMIPLHNENIKHQYAMLCTGIKLLSKVTNITE